jgi:hypothetical protein
MWLLTLLLAPVLNAAGVELQVQYSAIQKVMARQMFGESGRMYVKGSPETRCSFAYLENPVLGEAAGRIEIRARFSGKNAANFFGRCIGFGGGDGGTRFDLCAEGAGCDYGESFAEIRV